MDEKPISQWSMPDFTNPAVIFGTFFSLARAGCLTLGYVLFTHGIIDKTVEREIEGLSIAIASVLWMIWNNHKDVKKLNDSVKNTLEAVAVEAVNQNETVKDSIHAVAAQADVIPTRVTIQAIATQERQ